MDANAEQPRLPDPCSAIVAAIDSGSIRPSRWEVCRRLVNYLPDCAGLKSMVVEANRSGTKDDRARLAQELWRQIRASPFKQGAKFRILVSLTNDDGPLDWYEAEFIVEFAESAGVNSDHILFAFGLLSL